MSEKWVLVPKKETEEMRAKGSWHMNYPENCYRAMLAVVPPIPAEVLEQMVERGLTAFLDEYEGGDTRASIRACILAALGEPSASKTS